MQQTLSFSPATLLLLPPSTGTLNALAWSPDGEQLVAVSSMGFVLIWETTSGDCVLQQHVSRVPLSAVAWSPQGRCLLLGDTHGGVSFFHLSAQTLTPLCGFAEAVTHLAWSPQAVDSRFLVVAGATLRVFTQDQRAPLTYAYATPLQDVSWSPDGSLIACVCANGLVEIWDAVTRRFHCVWPSGEQGDLPSRVDWDASGQRLALGTRAGTVQIHNLSTKHSYDAVSFSRFPIQTLQWGERYLVAGGEFDLTWWDEQETLTHCSATPVTTCLFDPTGMVLATVRGRHVAFATL
jgi:WD40 repeat protein